MRARECSGVVPAGSRDIHGSSSPNAWPETARLRCTGSGAASSTSRRHAWVTGGKGTGRQYFSSCDKLKWFTPAVTLRPATANNAELFAPSGPRKSLHHQAWANGDCAAKCLLMTQSGHAMAKQKGRAWQGTSPKLQKGLTKQTIETVLSTPDKANAALNRIEIPQDAVERIAELLTSGSSLIISDYGISNETGKDTDFIVLTH